MDLKFFVPGTPRPAGSKRGFALKKGGHYTGSVAIVDDCKTSRQWKNTVKAAALQHLKFCSYDLPRLGPPFVGVPVKFTVLFWVPRPKDHYVGGNVERGTLKASAPELPIIKPDATKLLRAVEDALTGVAWKDDALIVFQAVKKEYLPHGGRAGCNVSISPYVRTERRD